MDAYEISYRAKWVAGKRKLNARLYFNRLARTFDLASSPRHGTPGAVNSRFAANIGPTYSGLSHAPVIPMANYPVTISINATDPDGIQGLILKYSVNGAAWQGTPMAFRDTSIDGARYTGLNSAPRSQVRRFSFILKASIRRACVPHPAAGTNSRALFVVEDGQAAQLPLHNFRVVMTPADAAFLHAATNTLSNELLRGTVIEDESEVFYNVGARLKGSFVGRNVARVGFHIAFNPPNRSAACIRSSPSTAHSTPRLEVWGKSLPNMWPTTRVESQTCRMTWRDSLRRSQPIPSWPNFVFRVSIPIIWMRTSRMAVMGLCSRSR